MRRTLIIIGSTVLVAGSAAVITAQHVAPASQHQSLEMLHSMCGESAAGVPAQAHVPEHFAKMLDLSSAQLTEIEKIATGACAVMRKTHENILQVLTPEQRAKVKALHGG